MINSLKLSVSVFLVIENEYQEKWLDITLYFSAEVIAKGRLV